LKIQATLANDDLAAARNAADVYLEAMEKAPGGKAAEESADLRIPAAELSSAADLDAARTAFAELSLNLKLLVKHVGTTDSTALFVARCPMAFEGEGAQWIQTNGNVTNPYYGKAMLRCGSVTEQIAGPVESAEQGHGHGSGHSTHH